MQHSDTAAEGRPAARGVRARLTARARALRPRTAADERVLDAVVQAAPDAYVAVGADGAVSAWNRAAETMFGWSRAEALGRPFDDLVVPAGARAAYAAVVARDPSTGVLAVPGVPVELPAVRKDASLLRVEVSVLRLDLGGRLGFHAFVRDVSARVAAQQQIVRSEERFRRIVTAANEGVWERGADGTTAFVNERMAQILGYAPADMVGRAPESFFADDAGRRDLAARLERRAQGMSEEYDIKLLHRGGHPVWLRASAAPILVDGRVAGSFALMTDVTAARDAQRQLQRQAVVFAEMDEAVFVMDADGLVVDCNRAAETMTGYRRDELFGRALGSQSDPRAAAELAAAVLAHIDEHASWRGDTPFQRKDGRAGMAAAVVVALRDEAGALTGAIVVDRDVTEDRRAAAALGEAERRFQLAFVNAPNGMIMTSLLAYDRGRVLDVNPAMCQLLGYSADELQALSFMDITHPDDRAADSAILPKLVLGEVDFVHYEKRYLRRDGSTVWAALATAVVRADHGASLYTVTQVQDITERRAARQRLTRANAELSLANAALARSNAELDRFAAAVAHDLKGPLTSIRGYAELLAEAPLSARELSAVGTIERNAGRMATLIDDLLGYARASSEPLALADVDAATLVRDVVGDLAHPLADSGAHVTVGPLPTVSAHPALLRQVLANLVGNALKYVAPGVAPRVHVDARRRGDSWELRVVDNGVGVPADAAESIFGLFSRAAGDAYEGTGIGLSTCQRIVGRHGGRIWVESAPGGGSAFCFTLPVAGAPAAPAGLSPSDAVLAPAGIGM